MKFKVFLFGMLAAVFMISCNNETVYEGGPNNPNIEGVSTHATFTLNFERPPRTYAGDDTIHATGYERTVSDAAMYIYKDLGSGISPEAMAYIPVADLGAVTPLDPTTTEYSITMGVTSGDKKIFLALNVNSSNTTPLLDNNLGVSTFIARPDTGIIWDVTPFSTLNNILYVAGPLTTDYYSLAPTLLTVNATGKADGLIQTFAGGSITPANGHLLSTDAVGTGMFCFMSNWDGPPDTNSGGPSFNYASTCSFTLKANVSRTDSKSDQAAVHNGNHIQIGVQRAYAKISLRITADGTGTNTSSSYWGPYLTSPASATDRSTGEFQPWQNSSNDNIWSLGGINKQEYPFQQFGKDFVGVPGADYPNQVLSPNWRWATGDTIIVNAPATSDLWYTNYDNTRVFGNTRVYGTATVDDVKGAMTTIPSAMPLRLSSADGGTANLVFAYATENSTQFPQKHDKSTYVVIGGVYTPENVITDVVKPNFQNDPADMGWNQEPAVLGLGPDQGFGINTHNTLNPLPYSGGALDTVYYLNNRQEFILGSDNLAKYIAWQLKVDFALSAPTVNDPAIADYIADLQERSQIAAYFQGNCWYRVWVRDPSVAKGPEEVMVRRNHVYDINITKISGPGIADPNKIIIPGEIIPEMETFVTADIIILDWHKVSSAQDVGFE